MISRPKTNLTDLLEEVGSGGEWNRVDFSSVSSDSGNRLSRSEI
jgi:hypothetical protein